VVRQREPIDELLTLKGTRDESADIRNGSPNLKRVKVFGYRCICGN
jgi:hypothetical protein